MPLCFLGRKGTKRKTTLPSPPCLEPVLPPWFLLPLLLLLLLLILLLMLLNDTVDLDTHTRDFM